MILDYIGTLVEPRNYSLEASKINLHKALCEAGLTTNTETFMRAYAEAHEKYRIVRYEKLREITNAIWVSEALHNAGCKVTSEDSRLKAALNVFFQDFIDSLELRPHAKKLMKTAASNCKVGLVSNFTYAPAIYASLRKFRINQFFHAVLISETVGWRKPHRTIFDEALKKLQAKAEDTVFVGDSLTEDICGAKAVGMRTIFVASHFNTLAELQECGAKPEFVFRNLKEICLKLPELFQET
jgi:HAD superfamily hydrolase (TIGR01549 family)